MIKNNTELSDKRKEVILKPSITWFESKGYCSITHRRRGVELWVADLFPSKSNVEPDAVGVKTLGCKRRTQLHFWKTIFFIKS